MITGPRRLVSAFWTALCGLALLLGLTPALLLLWDVMSRGLAALAPATWSGPEGLAPAVAGTVLMTLAACLLGVPVGLGAGLYLTEFPTTRLARITRSIGDLLGGTPSIVIGVFVWGWVVTATGRFSGWAGAVALALVLIPLVMRVTETSILAVPRELREAPLALGWPRWRATLTVTLRSALPGLTIALLIAVARVAGQAAPLLFTSLGGRHLSLDLREPMGALPLTIFTDALAPGSVAHDRAWAAAFLLVLLALALGVVARFGVRDGGRDE